jgi:primosomal protein N' (replication factor Y)
MLTTQLVEMKPLYADIALPVPVDKTFTYIVPPELHDAVKLGCRALVPFGRKYSTGIIVKLSSETTIPNLKPIRDILDAEPTFSEEMLKLTSWIAEYYFTSWGEVLKAAAPGGFAAESKRIVRLLKRETEPETAGGSVEKKKSPQGHAVLDALSKSGALSVRHLQRRLRLKGIHAVLNRMVNDGLVVIEEELPLPRAKPRVEKFLRLSQAALRRTKEELITSVNGKKQQEILGVLLRLTAGDGQPIPMTTVLRESRASLSSLASLEAKGLLEVELKEVPRKVEFTYTEPRQEFTLNRYQLQALTEIERAIAAARYQTFLLHGVTGSGKTQVYIEAIDEVLKRGRSAIVLVPEISLTPQMVYRFRNRFGETVAVFHSRMSAAERYDAWRRARMGTYNIVIGPRSAVFAPLKNLGLIVVDEEQEATYKQFDAAPRYNARDVAIIRATYCHGVVILGSATPSVESYHNARSGKYRLLELPERVDKAKMPAIEIVDMVRERKEVYAEARDALPKEERVQLIRFQVSSISRLLRKKIDDRLAKKEGVILLQNRRGFAPFLECPDCGYVEMCDQCAVTLTYHLTKRILRCHYCGFVKDPPSVCPRCRGVDFKYRGFGTQRVEEELTRLFPSSKVLRMDLDTTTRKGSHDRLLKKFSEEENAILLGTQMVAKGLDFSKVTLVGVISADTQLLLPDFRSSERTFQLLAQVAGRAGRRELAGEVIIQTLQPTHYSIRHVVQHDFNSFYEEELQFREELDYPPFSHIILVEFKGGNEKEVARHADRFAQSLRRTNSHMVILGPAPAALSKLRGQYRWHILVKDLKSKDISGRIAHEALRNALRSYQTSAIGKSRTVKLIIDADPQSMM